MTNQEQINLEASIDKLAMDNVLLKLSTQIGKAVRQAQVQQWDSTVDNLMQVLTILEIEAKK